jgi:hypothetical protein
MPKYNVWMSYMEQWDANDIDPPDLVIDGRDPTHAAEQFADRKGSLDDEIACVVQDQADGKYYEIELVKKWEVDMYKPTTLEELCTP